MATVNKDFRVKDGLIVGNNVDVLGSQLSVGANNAVSVNEDAYGAGLIHVKDGISGPGLTIGVAGSGDGGQIATSGNLRIASNNLTHNGSTVVTASNISTYAPAASGTSAAIGNALVQRDANGSAEFVDVTADSILIDAGGSYGGDHQISGGIDLDLTSQAGIRLNTGGGNALRLYGGRVDVGNNVIENLSDPTQPKHAANKSYVDSAITNLVNGAPGVLDTLAELANALGEDENFATTISNNIATNKNIADNQYANALAYTDDQIDAYLNSTDGTTYVELTSYTDTAIATGDATATPEYKAISLAGGYTKLVSDTAAATNAAPGYLLLGDWGVHDKSAKLTVTISSFMMPPAIHEILVAIDGSGNAHITEYGQVFGGSESAIDDIDIYFDSYNNPSVKVTPNSSAGQAWVSVQGTLFYDVANDNV